MDIHKEWYDICEKAGVHPYCIEAENLYDEISNRLEQSKKLKAENKRYRELLKEIRYYCEHNCSTTVQYIYTAVKQALKDKTE